MVFRLDVFAVEAEHPRNRKPDGRGLEAKASWGSPVSTTDRTWPGNKWTTVRFVL